MKTLWIILALPVVALGQLRPPSSGWTGDAGLLINFASSTPVDWTRRWSVAESGPPSYGVVSGYQAATFTDSPTNQAVSFGKNLSFSNNWTVSVLCRPTASTTGTFTESTTGTSYYNARGRVRTVLAPYNYPPESSTVACTFGISIGNNAIVFAVENNSYSPPLLQYTATLTNWMVVSAVCSNNVLRLYVDGRWVRNAQSVGTRKICLFQPELSTTRADTGRFRGQLGKFVIHPSALSSNQLVALCEELYNQ